MKTEISEVEEADVPWGLLGVSGRGRILNEKNVVRRE